MIEICQWPHLDAFVLMTTGQKDASLALVATRAAALKDWLSVDGYTDLLCEVLLPGHLVKGAETSGMIHLPAVGPEGYLLIDHKTGDAGEGFGLY